MSKFIQFVLMIFFSTTAQSATIEIPKDYPSIQQGINAAVQGDTVLVAQGKYSEHLDFLGKAISVVSQGGPEITIIDGNQTGIPVVFKNNETKDTLIQGFTITNSLDRGLVCTDSSPTIRSNIICLNKGAPVTGGGGIFCHNGSPLIQKNIITDNYTEDYPGGAGIYCYDGAPKIIENTIYNNRSTEGGGGVCCEDTSALIQGNEIFLNQFEYHGGGLFIINGGVGKANVIVDNYIHNNDASPTIESFYGAGVYCTGEVIIRDNIISKNGSSSVMCGGGIFCGKCIKGSVIENNIIVENSAKTRASAIDCVWNSDMVLANNSIAMNRLTQPQTSCGALCIYESNITMTNNTVYGNIANKGAAIFVTTTGVLNMTNCIIWNNQSSLGKDIRLEKHAVLNLSYCDHEGVLKASANSTLNLGPGNITLEPLFADPADFDFHLRYDSPCRDAGDNNASGLLASDFEGDPRIIGTVVDMGADEFYTHLYYTGDATPGGAIVLKITDIPGATPIHLWVGSGLLNKPIPIVYGDWYLQFPVFFNASLGSMTSPKGTKNLPFIFNPGFPTPMEIPVQVLSGSKLTNAISISVK